MKSLKTIYFNGHTSMKTQTLYKPFLNVM